MTDIELIGCPDAEAALLGAALLTGRADDVLTGVTLDDFTTGLHQAVFDAMRHLIDRGEPVDPVTVLGEMRAAGTVESRHGRDLGVSLVALAEGCPTATNHRHYRRTVLEHSYRRRVRQAGERLTQAAADTPLDELQQLTHREHIDVEQARQRAGLTDAPTATLKATA